MGNSTDKLLSIRKVMSQKGIDALIIPKKDQYGSESIIPSEDRLTFISGFNGPVGIGLITLNDAIIWADFDYNSKYDGLKVNPGWKLTDIDKSSVFDYISQNLPKKSLISGNFSLFDLSLILKIPSTFFGNYKFVDDKDNTLESLMEKQIKFNIGQIIPLSKEFTELSTKEKYPKIVSLLHSVLEDNEYFLELLEQRNVVNELRYCITHLDDLSWLLNIRTNGNLISPFVYGYGVLYIIKGECHLKVFAQCKEKYMTKKLKSYFDENNIQFYNLNDIYKEFIPTEETKDIITVIDNDFPNYRLYLNIKENCEDNFVIISDNPIELLKSVKNPTEINGIKAAAISESIAYIKLMAWIDNEIKTNNQLFIPYQQIVNKFNSFRGMSQLFMGELNKTAILNGAISCTVHPNTIPLVENILLNDNILFNCSAQYMNGTVEITRTFHKGTPTSEMKEIYTRVLLGLLTLERMKVDSEKASFDDLEVVPSSFLSQIGKDYPHLTCHKIGNFAFLREGPDSDLLSGNVFVAEPAYYEDNKYGIRIGNMYLIKKYEKDQSRIEFENLIYIPYEKNYIDFNLLSFDMVKYIDDYHSKIYKTLSPFLKDDKLALKYLKEKTGSIF
ncbi:MAG: aminopeptidase P family N-terminal domain-containing protein [archaeon]|nr:aminopeptidase P family N-terminal domain-containing protein [archaeon]